MKTRRPGQEWYRSPAANDYFDKDTKEFERKFFACINDEAGANSEECDANLTLEISNACKANNLLQDMVQAQLEANKQAKKEEKKQKSKKK